MSRHFPLAAVLAVRQQKEELEERALAALLAEIHGVHVAITQAEQAMIQHGQDRAREISIAHNAVHHQACQARWTMLRESKRVLLQQLGKLKNRQAEQQSRYLRARADREMLSELKAAQRASWAAELQSREAKQMDDLFAARRLRD